LIFVTVGSQLPFRRLVDAMVTAHDSGEVGDLLIQHLDGGRYDARKHPTIQFVHALSERDTLRAIDDASLVVSHFGMGTVLHCLERRRPLLAMPRDHALNEARNDHQLHGARRFAGLQGVKVVQTVDALRSQLRMHEPPPCGPAIDSHASPELLAAVRDFIWDGRTPPPPRA